MASSRTNTAKWLPNQGRWQINVQRDGVRRSFTSSTPGRAGQREANAKADAWLNNNLPANRRMTVQQAYDLWFASLKLRTSQSNWRPLRTRWQNRILPHIGALRLDRVTEQRLQDVIDANFADGLSRKSLSLMCADMRALFKFCRRSGYCSFQPEDLVVPAGARNKERRILQPSDLVKLFQCTDTLYRRRVVFDDYIYAYRFQVVTGLRPGELIALRWDDIVDDSLWVRRSVNVYGEQTHGKNSNAVRAIRLFPMAKQILRDQYESFGTQAGQDESDGPDGPDSPGGPGSIFGISREAEYYKAFKRYCAHNGITDCSLYELRHTFVSIAKSLPEGQVKPIIGHSQSMDTFGVYSHAILGDSDRTAADIDHIFMQLLSLPAAAPAGAKSVL